LVGDASGSVDPLTGEGLGLGFRQAAALVQGIAEGAHPDTWEQAGDLDSYETAHARIGEAPRLISRLMLMMDRHPRFRRRVLHIFAREPLLFSRLLSLNVGELAVSQFGIRSALRLGWHMFNPGVQPQINAMNRLD
jgi:2-polyprenyl-6-methoxyphenol hydroxylase-like FAD-dependent oxidoreductase